MRIIEVNNGRQIELYNMVNGITVITTDERKSPEESYTIPDHEIVMLLNYYRNCKDGTEKSHYILKGALQK